MIFPDWVSKTSISAGWRQLRKRRWSPSSSAIGNPLQAAPRPAGLKVYNFEGLVGGRGCEQPLMFGIHGHMVEPALDLG